MDSERRAGQAWAGLAEREPASTDPHDLRRILRGSGQETLEDLVRAYRTVRSFTTELCRPLAVEDYVAQSMTEASPVKWQIAHVTWFFEEFLLKPMAPGYAELHPRYSFLFNSYYNAVGERTARHQRGLITRPSVREVFAYRHHVDQAVLRLLETGRAGNEPRVRELLILGLHHEQQHQELILTDLQHLLSLNPLDPVYLPRPGGDAGPGGTAGAPEPLRWRRFEAGLRKVGHSGSGFAYDNERPAHTVYLEGFEMADRLITNGEFLKFMEDGGYERPELWLDAGWSAVNSLDRRAPLYWRREGSGWSRFTLRGPAVLDPSEPVSHVSFFEADAYARWAGARLPLEAEWEVAASTVPEEGNFAESRRFVPTSVDPARGGAGAEMLPRIDQMFGDLWEWTGSAYRPYPGFRPEPGAVGEYNGKFMSGQFVLRGGSCATSFSHIRSTYRNFFHPGARWQFSGIRLARDVR